MDTTVWKVISWLCIFSAIEASLNKICNVNADCADTIEACNTGICVCSTGHVNVNGECKSSIITVTLTTSSSRVVFGSSVILTAAITSEIPLNPIKWQIVTSSGTVLDLDLSKDKYTETSGGSGTVKLTITGIAFTDINVYRVQVSNTAGTTSTSNHVSLTVTGGALVVTTGSDVTGRVGGSVTIGCTVTGPELNSIHWLKYINNIPVSITIDSVKYSGGSVSSKALTIHSLTNDDARQYQCTASNAGGVYSSVKKATITVEYGQFYEDCTNSEPCDSSKFVTCTNGKCLCASTYYHKDQMCYPKTGLASTAISLNSTTSGFSVFWNNPASQYELVSCYEVIWRVSGISSSSSGQLGRAENQFTVTSNLTPGQLYIVNVISHVDLTDPTQSIVVTSADTTVRLVPLPPGPILIGQSSFAHDNFIITWTAPVNTFVTKYRISIDGATQHTLRHKPEIKFKVKVLTPGMNYTVKIATLSGTTDVKESLEHIEIIRITPTKPGPPTNVRCPESPLDVSLEISWTAPTNPNGRIVQYLITIKEQSRTLLTSSDATTENVEGLLPEQAYTLTVQTINDAAVSIRVSDPTSPVTCKTKYGVSGPPTNLVVYAIKSRGFHIGFYVPNTVFGILAGYKILITKDKECVQQIQVIASSCATCMSTRGCPAPITHNISDLYLPVSYTVTDLKPHTQYTITVTAINGVGEGHRRQISILTDEEVPQKPGEITSSDVQANQITLFWNVTGPSPGNTTYTISVYEASDDKGTEFTLIKDVKVFGFDTKSVSVTDLEEYWSYKFKVNAATVKGNKTSKFSSGFTTKQAPPENVEGLTVYQRGDDFRTAYVRWSLPPLRDHNSILANYEYETNYSGEIKKEYIPVSLFQQTVQRTFPVVPSSVYFVQVSLMNIENMTSPPSKIIYRATVRGPEESNTTLVVGSVVGGFVLLPIILTVFFMWKRKQSQKKKQTSTYTDIFFDDFSKRDQTYSSLEYESSIVHQR